MDNEKEKNPFTDMPVEVPKTTVTKKIMTAEDKLFEELQEIKDNQEIMQDVQKETVKAISEILKLLKKDDIKKKAGNF